MKRFYYPVVMFILFSFFISCADKDTKISIPDEAETVKVKAIGQEATKHLIDTLKSALSKSIKANGPIGAINICNMKATPLTDYVAKVSPYSIEIKRTTSKYRNPENAPDIFEKKALQTFENSPELPVFYIQEITDGAESFFYYYQPLKMVAVCIICHGDPSAMNEDLVNVLKEKYPADLALGYKEGEFRGLVRVKVKL